MIHGEAVKKEIGEEGRKLLDAKDPARQAQLEQAAAANTLNLLTATQHPFDAEVPFNPSFLCVADKIHAAGATDADYMAMVKNTFRLSQVPVKIVRDVYTEPVGGETFSVIDVTVAFPGGTTHQRYYGHIRRGYALNCVITYLTQEQLRTLTDVIKSVRFR